MQRFVWRIFSGALKNVTIGIAIQAALVKR